MIIDSVWSIFSENLTAARELQTCLRLPVRNEREDRQLRVLRDDALPPEGFRIDADPEGMTVTISGGGERGMLYGAFTFLEEHCGVRWFAPDCEIIPERDAVEIPDGLHTAFSPRFEYRDVFWKDFSDERLSAHLKINAQSLRTLTPEYGGGIAYGLFVHTLNQLMPQSYRAEHPEYFSDDGLMPCLTNEAVFGIVLENLKEVIRAHPEAKIFSVSQNDSLSHGCNCPACAAVDREEGSHMGSLLRFVNRIAAAIEPEFPDVLIDTLAYTYTRKAPRLTRPRRNVIIRLCSIECCFSHPIGSCSDKEKDLFAGDPLAPSQPFAQDLEDWSRICDRLYIWDYTTNFANFAGTFPNFDVIAPNIRFFASHGVRGVFEQGCYTTISPEFGPLKGYLMAKLLWNPDCDVEALAAEFTEAYYGPAWPYMQEYIDLVMQSARKRHVGICYSVHDMFDVTPEFIVRSAELWKKALAAGGTASQRAHVERASIQCEYNVLSARDYLDGIGDKLDPALHRALREKLLRQKITFFSEDRRITPDEMPDGRNVNDWCWGARERPR